MLVPGYHAVVLAAHQENIVPRGVAAHVGARDQRSPLMLSEIAEQNAMFKERVGFFQSGGAGGFQ